MQNRLRVRRLTLAPVRECLDEEPASAEEDEVDVNRTMHRVHVVEDRIGYRFWAKASDSESDEEEELQQAPKPEISTTELVRQAQRAGFTI
jgi:hypothetical protein